MPDKPATDSRGSDAKALLDHYHEKFRQVFHASPAISGKKDMQLCTRILEGRALDQAKAIVSEHLDNPSDWYAARGLYGLEHILKELTTIVARLSGRAPAGTTTTTAGAQPDGWPWGYSRTDYERYKDAAEWEQYVDAHADRCGWGGELQAWPSFDEWAELEAAGVH